MDSKEGNVTASVEIIAYQNMLLTEAIFEILAEKNILTGVAAQFVNQIIM